MNFLKVYIPAPNNNINNDNNFNVGINNRYYLSRKISMFVNLGYNIDLIPYNDNSYADYLYIIHTNYIKSLNYLFYPEYMSQNDYYGPQGKFNLNVGFTVNLF